MRRFLVSLLIPIAALGLLITLDLSLAEITIFLKRTARDIPLFVIFFLILFIAHKRKVKEGKIVSSFLHIKWGLVDFILVFAILRILDYYYFFKKAEGFLDNPIYGIIRFCILFLLILIVINKYKQNLKDLGLTLGKERFYIRKAFRWGIMLLIFRVSIFLIFGLIDVSLRGGKFFSPSYSFGVIMCVFLKMVVLTPVMEEVFFRGFGYPAFSKYVGTKWGMLFNSLLFSLCHFYWPNFNLINLMILWLAGYGCAYLYEKSKSLAAPIVFHGMANISALLVRLI